MLVTSLLQDLLHLQLLHLYSRQGEEGKGRWEAAEAVTENKDFHRNLSLTSHGTLQGHMVTLAASQLGEVNIFSLTHWIKLGSLEIKR